MIFSVRFSSSFTCCGLLARLFHLLKSTIFLTYTQAQAPAGFFPVVGRLGDLWDRSPPAGSGTEFQWESGGKAPPRSWRHVWKIVHKYFVYWDFWQHLLVNNAEKKHFQLGQVSPLPMHASVVGYHGDVTIAVLDLLCAGRRFNCQPFHFQVTTLAKLFTSGIICYHGAIQMLYYYYPLQL